MAGLFQVTTFLPIQKGGRDGASKIFANSLTSTFLSPSSVGIALLKLASPGNIANCVHITRLPKNCQMGDLTGHIDEIRWCSYFPVHQKKDSKRESSRGTERKLHFGFGGVLRENCRPGFYGKSIPKLFQYCSRKLVA
ncbi:hypothetical protein CDAR_502511 [Caerostris darwini]|uniref:Uncharacterized protein n=1 Tax=Caerostris darwini TaxID=1538125 RepID=A0AAV4VNS7_9ARAC|nr:hypothetical protein CDAR_502511 [Caerostris darwini]